MTTSIAATMKQRKALFQDVVARLAPGAARGDAAALVSALTRLTEYALDEEAQGALDAEADALVVARQCIGPLLQARLQRRADTLDAAHVGEARCPKCDGSTESQGRRSKTWTGLVGPLTVRRRYSHCASCGVGVAPAQRALGLGEEKFTPRCEEVVTMMATTVPHGMAASLVEEFLGARVSEKAVQQMVERRAEIVGERLATDATRCEPYDEGGLPVDEPVRPEGAVTTIVDVAYLEMDGVVPMTREELLGKELSTTDRRKQRRAKQAKARGGRGRRYRLVGREVKNAVLYAGTAAMAESPSRGCLVDKRYVSHLGDYQQFARRVWVELSRLNYDNAKLLVVISDGADWIRSVCAWVPASTLLILDLFHVKHRIWEVANSLYGEHTAAARTWADTQCTRVEAGQAPRVVEALRFVKTTRTQTLEHVRALREYLTNNRDRMDYPRYRAMGLRVGSGAVESANYHVTGARLKLQGMRWSEKGAREMAHLRADLFNGEWRARSRQIAAAA